MWFKNIRVLIADGKPDKSGDRLYIDGCDFRRHVLVYNGTSCNFNDLIGRANLKKRKDSIYADIQFLTHKVGPTALLKAVMPHLYPAIGGKILSRRDKTKIMRFTVEYLIVSISPNADPRIKSIGKKKS